MEGGEVQSGGQAGTGWIKDAADHLLSTHNHDSLIHAGYTHLPAAPLNEVPSDFLIPSGPTLVDCIMKGAYTLPFRLPTSAY